MALFGSDWIEDKNDYDRNHSIPKQEDYDSLKEYENNHHIYNENDEKYDALKEYENNHKYFQD